MSNDPRPLRLVVSHTPTAAWVLRSRFGRRRAEVRLIAPEPPPEPTAPCAPAAPAPAVPKRLPPPRWTDADYEKALYDEFPEFRGITRKITTDDYHALLQERWRRSNESSNPPDERSDPMPTDDAVPCNPNAVVNPFRRGSLKATAFAYYLDHPDPAEQREVVAHLLELGVKRGTAHSWLCMFRAAVREQAAINPIRATKEQTR